VTLSAWRWSIPTRLSMLLLLLRSGPWYKGSFNMRRFSDSLLSAPERFSVDSIVNPPHFFMICLKWRKTITRTDFPYGFMSRQDDHFAIEEI